MKETGAPTSLVATASLVSALACFGPDWALNTTDGSMVDGLSNGLRGREMVREAEAAYEDFESDVDEAERASFERVTDKYNLVSKIGEGTFSTVYKAEDIYQHLHDYSWIEQRGGNKDAGYYVAIKRIYVTSSPQRIHNELDILRSLSGSENVLPMITAFRHEDQVFIVLPYFKHPDFRCYYKNLPLRDIRYYMRSLFLALEDVHGVEVLHRDVKPTNFLYDVRGRKGELVDFGLAERQQPPGSCPCHRRSGRTTEQMLGMVNPTHVRLKGVYLKDEQRPGKRANRAGTRGFRAPEVLLKCDSQYTAVDIWSAGVILLTFLSTRFPFFNSNDDVDALTEIAGIFGKAQIKNVAAQHNCSFETNISTLHERAISFTRLVHWSTDAERRSDDHPDSREQEMALSFLERCMTLDPWQRWTASEALQDPFLCDIEVDEAHDFEADNPATETEADYEVGGLESAADIDSPLLAQANVVVHADEETEADDAFVDSTSEARQEKGRPKEFVFLKTDDYPDEEVHNQMRQQLISNVNSMRARREASLKESVSSIHPGMSRPSMTTRAQSASASIPGQNLTRPVTPLHQILPNSPAQNTRYSQQRNSPQESRARAKSASPSKSSLTEVKTIDPRLTLYTTHPRADGIPAELAVDIY